MVDESTRAGLEAALRVAVRDQMRANATVEFLREKLGLADAATAALAVGEIDAESTARDVGPIQVADAEFYGMSQPQAAAIFLERAGRSRPQRTEAIVAALRKGGITFGGSHPEQTFYAILNRLPQFHRVGKGTWGLSAWYPNATRRTKGQQAAEAQPADADNGDPWGVADEQPEANGTESIFE